MVNTVHTADGPIPYLNVKGHRFPICITRDGDRVVPKVDKKGFGLYALPGGGEATAAQIRAMLENA